MQLDAGTVVRCFLIVRCEYFQCHLFLQSYLLNEITCSALTYFAAATAAAAGLAAARLHCCRVRTAASLLWTRTTEASQSSAA
jgi:hypothetical protein